MNKLFVFLIFSSFFCSEENKENFFNQHIFKYKILPFAAGGSLLV